jgi:hypothetical protein
VTNSLQTATRVAATAGHIFAAIFILVGIWLVVQVELIDGIWLVFIGLFLFQAGSAESAQGRR